MARMANAERPSWCPVCHGPPGEDCPDVGRGGRWVRRELARQLRREANEAIAGRREVQGQPGK